MGETNEKGFLKYGNLTRNTGEWLNEPDLDDFESATKEEGKEVARMIDPIGKIWSFFFV
jgi:uncharacterized protein YaaQ